MRLAIPNSWARDREHAQPRFLHHQPLIQSDDMKWRFPKQRAPAILDGTPQNVTPILKLAGHDACVSEIFRFLHSIEIYD